MQPSPVRARLGPILWVMAGLTMLATCAEPVRQDYTQRFPLGTQPETVNLPAHYAGKADPFAGAGEEQFDTLVETFSTAATARSRSSAARRPHATARCRRAWRSCA